MFCMQYMLNINFNYSACCMVLIWEHKDNFLQHVEVLTIVKMFKNLCMEALTIHFHYQVIPLCFLLSNSKTVSGFCLLYNLRMYNNRSKTMLVKMVFFFYFLFVQNPEYKSLVYSFRQMTPEELRKMGTTYR